MAALTDLAKWFNKRLEHRGFGELRDQLVAEFPEEPTGGTKSEGFVEGAGHGTLTNFHVCGSGSSGAHLVLHEDEHFMPWNEADANPPQTLTVSAPGVLDNDQDCNSEHVLSVAGHTPPQNGVITMNSDGSFQYTPNNGYTGPEMIFYVDYDGYVSASAPLNIYVYWPDLDVDSNNDGDIDPNNTAAGTDDKIEDNINLPGKVIAFNNDDDNNNGTPDYLEAGPVAGENDLVELKLDFKHNPAFSGQSVYLHHDGSAITIWDSQTKDNQITDTNWQIGSQLPVTLWIEGIDPADTSLDLVLLDALGFPTTTNDTAFVVIAGVDLDIDSDNDNGFALPDRMENEDTIEDDASQPGKIIGINDRDKDGDNVPDFADGYNLDGVIGNSDDENFAENFVPIVLEVPPPTYFANSEIRITYDASDPAVATRTADGSGGYNYSPAPGRLRIWTQNGNIPGRNPLDVTAGGHFVAPGTYTAAQLGYSGVIQQRTLFVEGIEQSQAMGDARILVEVDPDGPGGPVGFISQDAVRAMVVSLDLVLDGLSETYEDAPYIGSVVRVNNDISKQNVPLRITPDFLSDQQLGDYKFDPEWKRDYTSAVVAWSPFTDATHDVVIDFPNNVLVWNVTDWDGVGSPQRLQSGAVLNGNGGSVARLLVESIGISPRLFQDSIVVDIRDSGGFLVLRDRARYAAIEITAMVDGNRNHDMDDDLEDDRELLFWYNNDREDYHPTDAEVEAEDTTPNSPIDSNDAIIDQTRDLEDFAALHLRYRGPVYSLKSNVDNGLLQHFDTVLELGDFGIGVNIFKAYGSSALSPNEHVTNTSVAPLQAYDADYNSAIAVLPPGDSKSIDPDLLISSYFPYIFEAWGAGGTSAGQVTTLTSSVLIRYPDGRAKEITSEVNLGIRDIEEFYYRHRVPYTYEQRRDPDFFHFGDAEVIHSATIGSQRTFDANEDIVFVHGWNMADSSAEDDKKAFGETMYKRLYWQGYQGRFHEFDWPTFYDSDPNIGGLVEFLGLDALNQTYNPSEFQAFRSAQALKNVLSSLSGTKKHLFAHSMGNVVAAEALRQWTFDAAAPDTALVDSYIAMQGAFSAGAYASNAADANANSERDLYRMFPDGGLPNLPGAYWMVGTTAAVSNWANYYNPQDFALGFWKLNNLAKPLSSTLIPATVWDFYYEIESTPGAKFIRRDKATHVATNLTPGLTDTFGAPGTTAYETMSFIGSSRSHAIGVKSVPWFNINYDVSQQMFSTPADIAANHSFQFNHDASRTYGLYTKLRVDAGLTSTL